MDNEGIFSLYLPHLTQHIKPSRLIRTLWKEDLPILHDICTDVMKLESSNAEKAATFLLKNLVHTDDPEIYQKIIAALKLSEDYEDLGELLEGPFDLVDTDTLKLLIEKFTGDLKYIDPDDLIPFLCEERLLSPSDKEDIDDVKQKSGSKIRAVYVLLNRIARKKGWCTKLLEAMENSGHKSLSKKIRDTIGGDQKEIKGLSANIGGQTATEGLSTLSGSRNGNKSANQEESHSIQPVEIKQPQVPYFPMGKDGIAIDSDEEEEMLARARQLSMQDTPQEETIPKQSTDTNLQQPRETSDANSSLISLDEHEESSSKRHLHDIDDVSSVSGLDSVKFNTSPNKVSTSSPLKKQLMLEGTIEKPTNIVPDVEDVGMEEIMMKEPSNSTPSVEELRKIRLARFDPSNVAFTSKPSTISTSSDAQVISNLPQSSETKLLSKEVTVPKAIDHTSEKTAASKRQENKNEMASKNDLNIPHKSKSEQEMSDYELALKLQQTFDSETSLSHRRPQTYGKSSDDDFPINPSGPSTSIYENNLVSDFDSDREIAKSLQMEEDNKSAKILNVLTPANINHSDDENEPADVNPEPLELRPYQEELAKPAKLGQNTVIVAPTGSGKTHVALAISKTHLESRIGDISEEPKIAFIVPTVALVEQQKKQFKKYLGKCSGKIIKIIGISGETTQRITLGLRVQQYDIFILTPQILVDALKNDDNIPSIGIFTLIIFDECHHTMKDHPYNMVMHNYFDEKFCSRGTRLPQIVGLTASVGVGKADKPEKAITHILTLCANLDSKIQNVREEKKVLDHYVNNPFEETHEVKGRRYDPFKDSILRLMTDIEERLNEEADFVGVAEMADFKKKMTGPAERGSERYTQWISALNQPITQIYSEDKRRVFVSCIHHLKIYNNALLLNIDCQTQDAFAYIERQFEDLSQRLATTDETDIWLRKKYEQIRDELRTKSEDKDGKYKNPKLERLKEVILDKYSKKPDSRGIIFCKTRELTLALQNWILADTDMKYLNPHKLVGGHAPENKGGMTQRHIEDVLKFFKHGTHKLIIATTVAEEGLDISKCNLVIRYEHVTNETARIQSKGRGRAENACYILFCQEGGGTVEKENLNRMREQLMEMALSGINEMSSENFKAKIKNLQQKARIDREMKRIGKQRKPVASSQKSEANFTLRCFKCNKYACMASDIRKIEGAHHIVMDDEFEDHVEIKVYPSPVPFKEFNQLGKLFCKNCYHEWGVQTDYKNVRFFVIKIKGFILADNRGRKGTFKQWKDVPFHVPDLTFDELENFAPQIANNADEWISLNVR